MHVLRGISAFQSKKTRQRRLSSRARSDTGGSSVLSNDVRRSNEIYIPYLRKKANTIFAVGDNVITCLGRTGTIEQKARKEDGIYTVYLDDEGAIKTTFASSLITSSSFSKAGTRVL